MKRKTARALESAAYDLGNEITLKENYSGRGMFGKSTVAVVVERWSDLLAAAAHAAVVMGDEEADEFIADLKRVSVDSMGRGVVVY